MWPGTSESTLNQKRVSWCRLMIRTSLNSPVPSALQADEPLPPCTQPNASEFPQKHKHKLYTHPQAHTQDLIKLCTSIQDVIKDSAAFFPRSWDERPYPDFRLYHLEDSGCFGAGQPVRRPRPAGSGDDGREQVVQPGALARQAAALHGMKARFTGESLKASITQAQCG